MVAALLILGSSVGVGNAQTKSVYWKTWNVNIDRVDTSGNSFHVVESYDIQFTGSFTFGTAGIPLDRVENINNVQVSQSGQQLSATCSGGRGTFCAQNTGSELQITYYFFQPIQNSSGTFDLSYDVYGAIRVYDSGDQLWWDGVSTDHYGFPVQSSTITVQLPSGFAPREGIDPIVTYGAPGEITVNGGLVKATATRTIAGNEGFSLRIQYPHDPNAHVPSWQASFDQQRTFNENIKPLITLGSIGLSVLIGLGSVLGLMTLYNTRGRDPKIGPVPEYLSEPPSDLRPAVVGSLIDESADPRDVIATFIDLAHRGYMVIEEEQKEGLFGIGRSSSYAFKRTDKSLDDLKPWERALMNSMFPGNRLERDLAALKESFYTTISTAQRSLYQELVREGFFSVSPDQTRARYGGIGALAFGLALVIAFAVFPQIKNYGIGLLLVPLSLFIPAIGLVVLAPVMPAKTQKGAEEAAKWKAFYKYIANLGKYASVEEAKVQFESYLPYAVAFGLDKTWVGAFRQVRDMPIPYWYYPVYGGYRNRHYTPGTPLPYPTGGGAGFPGGIARAGGGSLDDLSGGLAGGLESISSGLTGMLDDASRIMTSRPQQASSGGSGSWRSGGSSWSGGGFHGGGGSGGGSRGFG